MKKSYFSLFILLFATLGIASCNEESVSKVNDSIHESLINESSEEESSLEESSEESHENEVSLEESSEQFSEEESSLEESSEQFSEEESSLEESSEETIEVSSEEESSLEESSEDPGQEETHKEPTRTSGTYDVEFANCYYGKNFFSAMDNAEEKLNYGITSTTTTFSHLYNYFDGETEQYIYESENTFYSNDVFVCDEVETDLYEFKGLKSKSTFNNQYFYFLYDGIGIEIGDCGDDKCENIYYDYYTGIDDVRGIMDLSYYLTLDNSYSDYIGVDKDGNGIIYTSYTGNGGYTVSDGNGGTKQTKWQGQMEALILFDGDPITGTPWGIFYHDAYYTNYQNGVWTEDLELTEESDMKFILSYDDELEEYEELEYLCSLLETPSVVDVENIYISKAEATLNEDRDGFDTFGAYSKGTWYNQFINNSYTDYGKKANGTSVDYVIFNPGNAYLLDLYTVCSCYDAVNKEICYSYDPYCDFSIVIDGELPYGLLQFTDSDGHTVFYSTYGDQLLLTTNFEISATYDELNELVITGTVTVSFDDVAI